MQVKNWQQLTKQELYQLLSLRLEVFSVEQNCPYQDCDGLDQQAIHFMEFHEQQLVAYLRLIPSLAKYQGNAAIGRVCCAESARGIGLAKKMMAEAISYTTKHYNKNITVSAQAYLEKFYQELGFKICSEPYLEDGIAHIEMERLCTRRNK